MFAVIQSGGKQYKVSVNDVMKLEKIEGEEGRTVTLDHVLIVSKEGNTVIGSPTVQGAQVKAEILAQKRDKKIIVFKKERRQHYRRKRGHRQDVTFVRIKDILVA